MASGRIFTNDQWAVALGVALALHAMLAWSLLSGLAALSSAPAGQDLRLGIETLSPSGAEAPLLSEVAADSLELAMTPSETPPPRAQQAVAPPEVQPMKEVVPIERKPPRTAKEKPKTRPNKQQSHKVGKLSRSRKGKADMASKGRNNTDSGDASGGKKKNRTTSLGGVDRAAAPVSGNPRPRYPSVARSRGQEGRVLIRVSVLGNGRVGSARVARSSGHGSLDRAALKAVKRWRFKPALRAGKPVTATLTVPVTFRLEG